MRQRRNNGGKGGRTLKVLETPRETRTRAGETPAAAARTGTTTQRTRGSHAAAPPRRRAPGTADVCPLAYDQATHVMTMTNGKERGESARAQARGRNRIAGHAPSRAVSARGGPPPARRDGCPGRSGSVVIVLWGDGVRGAGRGIVAAGAFASGAGNGAAGNTYSMPSIKTSRLVSGAWRWRVRSAARA